MAVNCNQQRHWCVTASQGLSVAYTTYHHPVSWWLDLGCMDIFKKYYTGHAHWTQEVLYYISIEYMPGWDLAVTNGNAYSPECNLEQNRADANSELTQ